MSLTAYYLVSAVIGALVATVEIFQRYRAEPIPALRNWWAVAYLLFNAAIAAFAFYVAVLTQELTAEAKPLDLLQWSTFAGFGAAAFLRAKLLNLELSDGKEVALGPEIVVQTFLGVIDRELDRLRALDRFETVRELMKDIDFERSKLRLPIQVFQAMQTVTEEETEKVLDRIAEVDGMTSLENQDKAYLLGFFLLDLVGERFLHQILENPEHIDDFKVVKPPEDDPSAVAAPG